MAYKIQRTPALGPMDDSWTPADGSAELIENMSYSSDRVWRSCGGYTEAFDGSSGMDVVHSIHWFSQHGGRRQWVVLEEEDGAGALDLKFINFSTGALGTIEAGRNLPGGPSAGTTYYDSGDWCYVLNGVDRPIRWNGREVVRVGFEVRPAPPQVSVASGTDFVDQSDVGDWTASPLNFAGAWQRGIGEGAGSGDPWLYGWAVSWINDLGQESPLSAISWLRSETPATTPAVQYGFTSAFVSIEAAPDNVRGIRLWRTVNLHQVVAPGTLPPMYLVDQFATGGTVTVIDDHNDDELIVEFDRSRHGLWPARALLMAEFKGTRFVSVDGNVRFSAPSFPEQMPELNLLEIGGRSSGPVTGMHPTKNALVVFKPRGIYLVKGDPISGFYTEPLTEDDGTESPRSLVEIPGVGLAYWGTSGPSVVVGALENTGTPTGVQSITRPVGRFWREEYSSRSAVAIRAVRNLREREVWWQVPTHGDDRPRVGVIWHMEAGGFSLRRDFPFSCMTETQDHRGLVLAGSWDTSGSPGVWVYTRGANLNGESISSTYREAWTDPTGVEYQRRSVVLYALNTGRELSLDWHTDWQVGSYKGPPDVTYGVDPFINDPQAMWGTAVLGTDSWEPTVLVTYRVDLHQSNGRQHQWRTQSGRMELVRADTHTSAGVQSRSPNRRG